MSSASLTIAKPVPSSSAADETEDRRLLFRNAMARMGAAVSIVTTDGPGGLAGFAATAVCSVTDDPPTLLVCLNRSSSASEPVRRNARLCVNVLESEQADLSRLFGGKTPVADRFAAGAWSPHPTGTLALRDALASFHCEVREITRAGTHDVLFCEVQSLTSRKDGKALIYFDRAYHSV
mgnify:CR=1 FL=1